MVRVMDDKTAAKLMAVENFQRHNLDPVEEARAIEHMRETGWSVGEIADSVGRSPASVRKAMKVLVLPAEGLRALSAGELAIETAAAIAGLPEEVRERAIRDCVEPVFSARALSQREAMEMLREVYQEPLRLREDWRGARAAAENEWPTAVWLDYEEAREICGPLSGWSPVLDRPDAWLLAEWWRDKAPTWLELAKRHGAEIRLGCGKDGSAVAMVETQPLIDGEKALHGADPVACCFAMSREDEAGGSSVDREARDRAVTEAKRACADRDAKLEEEWKAFAREVGLGNCAPGEDEDLAEWTRDRLLEEFEEPLRGLLGKDESRDLVAAYELENADWSKVGQLAALCELASRSWDSEFSKVLLCALLDEGNLDGEKYPELMAQSKSEGPVVAEEV